MLCTDRVEPEPWRRLLRKLGSPQMSRNESLILVELTMDDSGQVSVPGYQQNRTCLLGLVLHALLCMSAGQ